MEYQKSLDKGMTSEYDLYNYCWTRNPHEYNTKFPGLPVNRFNVRLHMFAILIGTIRHLMTKRYKFEHIDTLDQIFRDALPALEAIEDSDRKLARPEHRRRLHNDLVHIDKKNMTMGDTGGMYITFNHFLIICEYFKDCEFESQEETFDLQAFAENVVGKLHSVKQAIYDLQRKIDRRKKVTA